MAEVSFKILGLLSGSATEALQASWYEENLSFLQEHLTWLYRQRNSTTINGGEKNFLP